MERRRQWHPTPVLLPGKSHGWRSLVGYSPWGRWESDTTEQLYSHFSLSCIGEGNGNPLPCSCLENPRNWGAWWASVYGVTRVGHDWSDLAAAAADLGKEEKHSLALSSGVNILVCLCLCVCLCLWTMTFAGIYQLFFFKFDKIKKVKGHGVEYFSYPM